MVLGVVGFVVGVALGVVAKDQILKLVTLVKGLVAKFKKDKKD